MYPDHINSTSQMASSIYRKYYTIMQLSIYHYLGKLVMNYLFISESTLQQRQVLSNNSIFFFSFPSRCAIWDNNADGFHIPCYGSYSYQPLPEKGFWEEGAILRA